MDSVERAVVSSSPYSERPWLAHYPAGLPTHLEYPSAPLYSILEAAAHAHPSRSAIAFFGKETSYATLMDHVRRLAGGLVRLGMKRGDRVAVMLPNCPQAVAAYYAILWAGGVVTMVNPLYTPRELEQQLTDSGTTILITLDLVYKRVREAMPNTPLTHVIFTSMTDALPAPIRWLYPLKARRDGTPIPPIPYDEAVRPYAGLLQGAPLASPVPVDPERDVAILQYTGGTTGTPKGVMLTHHNLLTNCVQSARWMNPTRPVAPFKESAPVIMGVIPLFHVYGMTVAMNLTLIQAGTMVLVPRFDVAQVLKLVAKHKVTAFPGAPTIYVAVNNHPDVGKYDLSSVDNCLSGSAPLPQEVTERFTSLTSAKMVEGYGLTEAAPVTHCNPLDNPKIGSIGIPWPDTDAAIVDPDTDEPTPVGDVGELILKGPQVMQGYWNRPEETAAVLRDGWLYTGDLGRMDENGYFYIVDRKKDVIIASGFNIYPREVEEVLYAHPAVQEAVVAGVPHPYRGETVKAYIVLRGDVQVGEEEITAFCKERLATFKVPKLIEFRNELPKSVIGKVLRRMLVEEERQREA